ncbi:FmdB family zinc ribbon protein [Tessaracoccus sp. Z1128]
MPTYQYRCTDCGTDHEAVQKFTDPALTDCPQCDGDLRKVFSAVGVVFKGSGFYATDSRSAKTAATAAKPAAKSEPAKAGAAPKAEAKSA